MQPFLAMLRPDGATMRDVLFSGYYSRDSNPIRLIMQGSWLTLGTLINMAMILLIAPLSSEAIFLDTRYDCPDPDPDSENPCWPPRISADRYILRVLEGFLGLIALVILGVIVGVVFSERPPLRMDPSTIAGAATLTHHPVLLQDFRAEHPDMSNRDLARSLPNRKYALQTYFASNGHWKYGIAPVAGADYGPVTEASAYGHHHRMRDTHAQHQRVRGIAGDKDLAVLLATIILAVGLLGVITAYYLDGSNSGFNRFFNSDSFGPRFVMTSVATLASVGFGSLQQGTFKRA
jgi:hypothetical protein